MLWLLALLAGCCTESGCIAYLVVEVTGVPDEGPLAMEVHEDGVVLGCVWDDGADAVCDDFVEASRDGGVLTWQSHHPEKKGTVDVRVEAGDDVLLDVTARPDWNPLRINGWHCGVTCISGTLDLAVE